VKIFKFLNADRAGARASRTAVFYRPVCDIHCGVERDPRTPERIARDHNETQAGNR
jgi:hypothetical protein